jgi:polyphosphate kinase 2 (PPK2 family)
VGRLDDVDLSLKLSKKDEKQALKQRQQRLVELRLALGGLTGDGRIGPPVCIVCEGWDASGKGGAIKRLVSKLDPRHVRVVDFAAPSADEKRHHFLWRFWPALPGWGGMAIFDRSWYGRVLVERVEALATPEQWSRAYDEINEFERSLTDEGTILIKFWFHISAEKQLSRFERRRDNPLKAWKLTEDDWRNRGMREQYVEAAEEMFDRTDRPNSPWHLIAAESKRFARIAVLDTVIERIEAGMREWGFEPPPPRD